MAAVGPALYPSANLFPGAGTYSGQGNYSLLSVVYSTSDVSVQGPVWNYATAVRAFSTSRGRDSDWGDIDAGVADISLDNRARTFDPVANPAIRPLNRWWIREQFNGVTESIFYGYAESYDQVWPAPAGAVDAVAVVHCVDETKPLSLGRLPTTDPPRNSYRELIDFDSPTGYWAMDDDKATLRLTGSPGPPLLSQSGWSVSISGQGAIVGEEPPGAILVNATEWFSSIGLREGEAGEVNTLNDMTLELWWQADNVSPAGGDDIVVGPGVGASSSYRLYVTGATLKFDAKDGVGATTTVTSGTIIANTWYHIVCTIHASVVKIYINGVVAETSAATFAGFANTLNAGAEFILGDATSAANMQFDNMAFWRRELSAATVLNHYTAGAARGFLRTDTADTRITAVLDSIGSSTPRSIRAGSRYMVGSYMVGQPPIDELRNAREAENSDAMLYISRAGAITFLDAAHRAASPWNTTQGTFGDQTGELPYWALDVDYSDAFLTNEWNVTATNGLVQTESDTTSISSYFKRSQSLSDVPVTTDSQAGTIATLLLAKYKDPMLRVVGITPKMSDPNTAGTVFARDLGDRIRVFRTPPGGGSRIDQTAYIQKIMVDGDTSTPFLRCSWIVSPL